MRIGTLEGLFSRQFAIEEEDRCLDIWTANAGPPSYAVIECLFWTLWSIDRFSSLRRMRCHRMRFMVSERIALNKLVPVSLSFHDYSRRHHY